MKIYPSVSIIIPCRNEGKFIGKCLDSIIAQNYPKERIEVFVVDGMSDDETRKIMENYIKKNLYIKLLDNPKKITPRALNIGIKNSKGDLVLWMSSHNQYEKEYVSKCVYYLKKFNADAVGGIIKTLPRNNTLMGNLICTAISHPFGVGKSIHKIGSKKPQWADTAFGVCYKKKIFKKVGTFNENLVRGQDMEFNLRLKKTGFRMLLVPEIVSQYYPRSNLSSFIKHNFKNGLWAILPFKYASVIPVSWRHLVPFVFTSSLIITLVLSIFSPFLLFIFVLLFGSYSIINLYFSLMTSKRKKYLKYFFLMPLMFFTLHMSYGLGSICGITKIIFSKLFWKNLNIILRKRN